ncbi:unnamed protein product [Discosporangium mesarthrocarpum]
MKSPKVHAPLRLCTGLAALGTSTALVATPLLTSEHGAFHAVCSGSWPPTRTGVIARDERRILWKCGRSRPVMALVSPSPQQRRDRGGDTTTLLRATVNKTERGQRLRALNWVKQVQPWW